MQETILVAVGGAFGSLARYAVALVVAGLVGERFPWGTLGINVLGSFVIGAVSATTGLNGWFEGNSSLRLLVMVGVCGGFTTFSSFSLQTLTLLRAGETAAAFANMGASVGLCLLATYAGVALFTRG